ncbi:MAG: WD40/YVTN/BNR-like repeat-containing protein [Longimicrobiaceae bacterium]
MNFRSLAILALTLASPAAAQVDSALFGGLRYRMIGPSRGGRVTTVAGVPSQPFTFYQGSTGGGVWKTTNAGTTWENVSDAFFGEASMGAVEVSLSDPNVVWAGTGSEGIRSNVSTGRGVYRSTDAGATWRWMGLREAGQIGAVRIHPADPRTVFVAAVGNAFRPNRERGVYRTRDGGGTWEKVLFVSDSTGAVDLEFQPGNPDVVYASMWRGERKPWTVISGAREGGIYKSTDGGTTWTKLGGGLPTGLFGKSNVAVSAADPRRVYALIEASPGGGLYRSDDAGESWALVSTERGLITRPFYYCNITADPTNADVVYVGTESFYKSTDGGRTWRTQPTPHGDNHDLWINPRDARLMVQSNDGGANVTLDGGRTWSAQLNQPTAEIYQVYTDSQFPYRVYGAQQDNTTLIVASRPLQAATVDDPAQSWRQGPGCETGPIIPHPTHPDTVYGSCKGLFSRMSLRTGNEKQYAIGAQSLYGNPGRDLIYRFQRVSPMEISLHDPRVIYYGSQYVHRTTDEGVNWERISPDLTANDPRYQSIVSGEPITLDVTGEEFYSTLYAIRESPRERGVIWTGANDGPVHVTRDGGRSWADVTPRGLPPGGRVQTVEPSPHRAGGAYVAVLRYLLGDFRPYAYRTNDYGRTWTRIADGANGIPADEPVRVVREDPERPGLLYAGTEFGMYVSFDDGGRWQPLQLNLPHTPVTDLKVHRGDLVASTQGRGFWILDDLSPLRQAADSVARAAVFLFRPRQAVRFRYAGDFGGPESGAARPDAPRYPPYGAVIDYFLRTEPASLRIEILDVRGTVVRAFTSDSAAGAVAPALAGTPRLAKRPGAHRMTWDLAWPGAWDAGRGNGRNGPLAVPGAYTVRMTADGRTWTQPLRLRPDPRAAADGVTQAGLEAQLAHNLRVRDLVTEVNRLVARVAEAKRTATGDVLARLTALAARLVTPPVRYSRPGLQAHIAYLYGLGTQADQRIGRDAVERYAVLRRDLDAAQAEARALIGPEPPGWNPSRAPAPPAPDDDDDSDES